MICRIVIEPFETREQALEAEQLAMKTEFPKCNTTHNGRDLFREITDSCAVCAMKAGSSENIENLKESISENGSDGRRLLDLKPFGTAASLGPAYILNGLAAKKLSLHIDIGDNSIAWFEDEIDDYLELKATERDVKAAQRDAAAGALFPPNVPQSTARRSRAKATAATSQTPRYPRNNRHEVSG